MKSVLFGVVLVAVLTLALAEPAMAGPGGKIAKAMFETFWGKVALALLTLIFLPLIVQMMIKEKLAERRATKDLRFMADHDNAFEWLSLKARVTECFHRIHNAWSREDMAEASAWMTEWYWQNQQLVFLERWEREGLVNECHVKKVRKIKPFLFMHRNEGAPHEGSILVISITAHMRDYLARRNNGKVVEGSKKFKDVETFWTFTLVNGEWLVADIEEQNMWATYANMRHDLPKIEDTISAQLNA